MSWMFNVVSIRTFGRLLGSFELFAAVLLALKPWFPKASVLGGLLASLFFVSTLSSSPTRSTRPVDSQPSRPPGPDVRHSP